ARVRARSGGAAPAAGAAEGQDGAFLHQRLGAIDEVHVQDRTGEAVVPVVAFGGGVGEAAQVAAGDVVVGFLALLELVQQRVEAFPLVPGHLEIPHHVGAHADAVRGNNGVFADGRDGVVFEQAHHHRRADADGQLVLGRVG